MRESGLGDGYARDVPRMLSNADRWLSSNCTVSGSEQASDLGKLGYPSSPPSRPDIPRELTNTRFLRILTTAHTAIAIARDVHLNVTNDTLD